MMPNIFNFVNNKTELLEQYGLEDERKLEDFKSEINAVLNKYYIPTREEGKNNLVADESGACGSSDNDIYDTANINASLKELRLEVNQINTICPVSALPNEHLNQFDAPTPEEAKNNLVADESGACGSSDNGDEEELYDVEKILLHFKVKGKVYYRAKFENYSNKYNQWLQEEMFVEGNTVLQEYKRRKNLI